MCCVQAVANERTALLSLVHWFSAFDGSLVKVQLLEGAHVSDIGAFAPFLVPTYGAGMPL